VTSVRVKVKVAFCFIRRDAVRASVLDCGDWLASRPDCVLHIHFNIILPSTPGYSIIFLRSRFPDQNFA
jgi:hypothetical protein